jgi:hypothetical protein
LSSFLQRRCLLVQSVNFSNGDISNGNNEINKKYFDKINFMNDRKHIWSFTTLIKQMLEKKGKA